jgi:hypothetical protein
MIRPTVLRNSAEPETVIGIALKIFYQANDWVDNSTFLDKLDLEYDAIGKQRESRSGGQAIAKYKPALYYGLLDVREDGARRINEYGRRYYEAYVSGKEEERVDCLISSISNHTFGSNNPAVPESQSKIEPPKVFLVSCLLLNNKISKTEYAYIIENLAKDKDYKKILVDISLSRLKNSELTISDYAKNNYRDDKGLKFLSDAGFFEDVSRGTKAIKEKYILKYSDVLSSLSILSEEEIIKGNTAVYHDVSETNSHMNYLTALRTKPFMLLAGISGTGKSRIVRKLAQASVTEELQRKYDPKSVENGFDRWQLHKPANFEIIQVKPNWHNSLEVVGYKSNIGGAHYEFTPFIEFLARAWKHQDIPFFLCLDEMNLAPVEQYFAEFLSAIESRSMEKDEYETDPIIKPFNEFGEKVCNEMLNHLVGKIDASNAIPGSPDAKLVERFKTKGLTLPKNLLVLGTVNMDETTFSFSRKVLDRAMSIVMNKVEYDKFFTGETENDMAEFDENIKNLLIDRPIRGLDAEENEADKVEEYLTAVNNVLDDTPFKLGYRAANEALLYVSAAHHFDSDATVEAALDEFTLMKILTRNLILTIYQISLSQTSDASAALLVIGGSLHGFEIITLSRIDQSQLEIHFGSRER